MRSKNTYAEKLLDPRWQKLRLEVFQRDKFTCQKCGDSSKTLNAHHSFYRKESDGPWDYYPYEIITLCVDCHNDEHDEMNMYREMFYSLMSQKGFGLSSDFFWLIQNLIAVELSKSKTPEKFEIAKQQFLLGLFGSQK